MKKSNLLTTAAAVMLLTAAPVWAQTCIKTPSCADLGYTQTAADCSGKTILKCPLDNTQVYCPGYEESLKTYSKGDIYYDERGIGIGTVFSVDSTHRHGIVGVSGGKGTPSEATAVCSSKTAGGLNWSFATGDVTCYILSPSGMSDLNSSSGDGYCSSGRWTSSSATNCKGDVSCGFACQAPF